MHENIFKFNSYTTAMNAQTILNGKGIRAQIKKYVASSEGCMYVLTVSDFDGARKILTDSGISYIHDSGNNGAL